MQFVRKLGVVASILMKVSRLKLAQALIYLQDSAHLNLS